ncbi:hypothetical protein P280DRAFT_478278 [Massarina eburnea CBS 473.64]|uniref:Uncharacterized protein n=1 Tax=Massarina eburnea CBS 473.64 TaxID=1395130 RepID=A0A6A6S7F7_9PLEO|nr:hypothetical protein P280DRAFT_478278 [Massarina eburnea CBS 473.64]
MPYDNREESPGMARTEITACGSTFEFPQEQIRYPAAEYGMLELAAAANRVYTVPSIQSQRAMFSGYDLLATPTSSASKTDAVPASLGIRLFDNTGEATFNEPPIYGRRADCPSTALFTPFDRSAAMQLPVMLLDSSMTQSIEVGVQDANISGPNHIHTYPVEHAENRQSASVPVATKHPLNRGQVAKMMKSDLFRIDDIMAWVEELGG